jgi:hypothetical protein
MKNKFVKSILALCVISAVAVTSCKKKLDEAYYES